MKGHILACIDMIEAGVSPNVIAALPAMFTLPPGICQRLSGEGVIRKIRKERVYYAGHKTKWINVWGPGPRYGAAMDWCKAHGHL